MSRFLLTVLAALTAGHAFAGEFRITSPDLADGVVKPAQIANVFGCTGGNVSPAVTWTDAPEGTQSFAVSLYDKDAPTGSGFWHWVVVDIPADATGLPAGAGGEGANLPKGARTTRNDAGAKGFLGACPPGGQTHDYILTVKALKVKQLPVPDDASGALVGFVSNMNVLATASITAKGSH
jgi:Raf kinase inhibitor-like YbhB/YbcL family protein